MIMRFEIKQFLETYGLLERTGVIPGLSNEAYHADRTAVSSTKLKLLLKSPRLYLAALSGKVHSTASQSLGTAVHAALLEAARFDADYLVTPKFNRRTKSGKAEEAAYYRTHAGKQFISKGDAYIISRVRESITEHNNARRLLRGGTSEQAIFFRDPRTGLMCKVKLDLIGDAAIVDVKTTTDASETEFRRTIGLLHYDLSAYMYQLAVKETTGKEKPFVFIAAETEEPFNTAVYIASQKTLNDGRIKFEKAMDTLSYCLSSGDWFGYQRQGIPQEIDTPGWNLNGLGIQTVGATI